MLRLIGFSTAIAVTNAIQLHLDAEKFATSLATPFWDKTDATYKKAVAASGKYTDKVFPADVSSIGVAPSADKAKGKPAPDPPIVWKRLSEIYGDKTVLFAPKDKQGVHSTITQGQIGNCYLISVLAGLDTREGLIESLFLNENKYGVSPNGVYSMKFFIDGEPVVVTVDDYVPTTKDYIQLKGLKNNQLTEGWWPYFAKSSYYGEIWPMIAEKAWAKLVGTYKSTAGGNATWVLRHVTDDPVQSLKLTEAAGVTASNAKGLAAWKLLKEWSARNYLLFTGTSTNSHVRDHAYTILAAFELNVNGKDVKCVTLRNPWGTTSWTEKFAADKTTYLAAKKQLESAKDFKPEGGWFVVTWEDYVKNFPEITTAHGEESRKAGRPERLEFRPRIKLANTGKKEYIKIKLEEDVDLEKDVLAIQALQGGNRIGTDRSKAFKKVGISGQFKFNLGDKTNVFAKTWAGEGVSAGCWDEGGEGNQHLFDASAGKKIPKGDYVLDFTPKWNAMSPEMKMVKEVTIRVQSHSKVGKLELLTEEQATDVLTGSKVEIMVKGKNCDQYDINKLGKALTLAQAATAAMAKGYQDFMWGEDHWAYGCSKKDQWCAANENNGEFNVYHVKGTTSNMKDASKCTVIPIGSGGEGDTVSTPADGASTAAATPKTVDDAMKQLKALLAKENAWVNDNLGEKILDQTMLGSNTYYCKEYQNKGTKDMKLQFTKFDSANFLPLMLKFENGNLNKTLKANEQFTVCAQFKLDITASTPPFQQQVMP